MCSVPPPGPGLSRSAPRGRALLDDPTPVRERDPRAVRAELEQLLSRRILVLDGAMGTMCQAYDLTEQDYRSGIFEDHLRPLKGDHDVLSLTRPEVIAEIHSDFLAAGADILETNTFNSTAVSQADYGLEHMVRKLNATSARLARKAADVWTARTPDKPRFVAGSMGPTNKTLSMSPRVDQPGWRALRFDDLKAAYAEQVHGLIEGGVDLLLVETIFDTLNSKAAIVAIEEVFDELGLRLPVMLSVAITDASGRTLSGQTVDAFWHSVRHARPMAIGVNCSLGAADMRPWVAELARSADTRVLCYPNAGLPNAFGQYDEAPETTASLLAEFASSGLVNLVGGCCGTTPEHIRAIARAVGDLAPRTAQGEQVPLARFTGLETLTLRPDAN